MRVSWQEVLDSIEACDKCPLRAGCTQTVPGEGDVHAKLMFIGEGPGAEEDRLGRPFVGASGQLLDKMIAAIGLSREEVYIGNVVKCRPPHNRQPSPEEAAACLPYLRAQVALVRPRVIVLLGATAARYTISPDIRITRDRGRWFERKGVWMMPTYHPSALLRDPALKRAAWADFQAVRDKLRETESMQAGGN
ncbi:MAG: uracil-DNA glycosylase [Clostridia bacterium]|nr:uracil-DNA glycosylase [Clostridia bacterium]